MALESPGTEERIGVASGLLRWAHDGDDLVAGRYRIRSLGPGQWETTCRGRLLRVDTRRSMALAMAEHHHREIRRIQLITRWGLSAIVSLLAATVAGHWISTPLGLALFAGAVWAFLSSVARLGAAVTRSLLDPYRAREPWEPPDWWNPHVFR
jgi:hypothetical protein